MLAQCEAKLMRLMDSVEGEQASLEADLVLLALRPYPPLPPPRAFQSCSHPPPSRHRAGPPLMASVAQSCSTHWRGADPYLSGTEAHGSTSPSQHELLRFARHHGARDAKFPTHAPVFASLQCSLCLLLPSHLRHLARSVRPGYSTSVLRVFE